MTWEPGDAAVSDWMGLRIRGYIDTDGLFYTTDPRAKGISTSAFAKSNLRPLVVIDPEDREQVARLMAWFRLHGGQPYADVSALSVQYAEEAMKAALREFADPAPEPVCMNPGQQNGAQITGLMEFSDEAIDNIARGLVRRARRLGRSEPRWIR